MQVRRALLTIVLVSLLLSAATVATLLWHILMSAGDEGPPGMVALRGSGELSVALTGDALLVRRLPRRGVEPGFDAVVDILKRASLAVTNLEQNLLARPPTPGEDVGAGPSWPYGGRQAAADLRDMGISVVSCANNHAIDYNISGMQQTREILEKIGLLPVGCGNDLDHARSPVFLGTAPRRVAVIAVAASAASESRATAVRGEISGRPGVSPLRYVANITADATTFDALRESLAVMEGESLAGGDELLFYGTPIKRGEATVVEIVADARDVEDILTRIRVARKDAKVVVLSLHSHEPSNENPMPADFLRQFARMAIDNGADIVFGHGPHQLRGIEAYGGGAILYSLGNFVFDPSDVVLEAADPYEAGADLYRLLLGDTTEQAADRKRGLDLDDVRWWEGMIAVAQFGDLGLESLRLYPIDLGVSDPLVARGLPRVADSNRRALILARVAALSEDFGTRIDVTEDGGMVDLRPTKAAPTLR